MSGIFSIIIVSSRWTGTFTVRTFRHPRHARIGNAGGVAPGFLERSGDTEARLAVSAAMNNCKPLDDDRFRFFHSGLSVCGVRIWRHIAVSWMLSQIAWTRFASPFLPASSVHFL
jgi:hypothetical protein